MASFDSPLQPAQDGAFSCPIQRPNRDGDEAGARRQRRVAMGCAGSKIDADAWIQPQPEPTPRQADAVVKESPYLQLDIKREGAAFMGSSPPLAEIHKKPDGSTFLTAVRNHFLKSKQPSATTIFGADAAVAAVVTGPEAPAEGGLSNHIIGGRGGGDMSARPKGGFVFAPAPLDPSATSHKKMEADGTTLYAIAQIMPRFTGGHTTGLGVYPAVTPGNKFAPLGEPALLMKYDNHMMCHTIVNVKVRVRVRALGFGLGLGQG